MRDPRRSFRRRKACPECGSRMVLVRYEHAFGGTVVAVRAPVEVRCTNEDCHRYWR